MIPELKNIQNNIININGNNDIAYTSVLDLKIPNQLHVTFSDYAPATEHILLQYDLSDYKKKTMIDKGLGPKPSNTTPKLMCTLCNKNEYVVDYRLVTEYIKLGVKFTKIHKGIKYIQKDWIKPYIEKNTKLRQRAKNDSGNFFSN